MKILLSEWAARNFCPAPHRHTLRKWRTEGMIYPVPVFIGRAYWVEDSARFIGGEKEAPPRPDLRKENRKRSSKVPLVERVRAKGSKSSSN